jgi:hypothetical protein
MEQGATQIAAKLLKSWLPIAPPLGTKTLFRYINVLQLNRLREVLARKLAGDTTGDTFRCGWPYPHC